MPEKMVKIVAISDLHGHLPAGLPEGDVLCICGDIFPLDIQTYMIDCDDWLSNIFIPWTNNLPFNDIFINFAALTVSDCHND